MVTRKYFIDKLFNEIDFKFDKEGSTLVNKDEFMNKMLKYFIQKKNTYFIGRFDDVYSVMEDSKEHQDALDEAYEHGYEDAQSSSYDEGYSEGYDEGIAQYSSYEEGFEEGYKKAKLELEKNE